MRSPAVIALSTALLLGTATLAHAQSVSGTAPASNAAGVVPTPSGQVEEIVVTAQKRAQSLQDVPISISVVQAKGIQERGVKQLSDLPALVPGFEFVRAPAQTVGLTFRGIGPQAGNVAFDSSIGMFVDGVFLGNNRAFNQTLFDLQRVEFIKGSQSALLGKNSTVGALSLVNVTPTDRLEGRIEGGTEVVDGGGYVDGALNVPVSDTVAVRVAGRYQRQVGYIRNVTTGLDGPDDRDWGVRAQVRYDGHGALNALLSYQHTSNTQYGSATQCTAPGYLIPGLPGAPYAPGTDVSQICGGFFGGGTRASFSSDPRLHNGDDNNNTRADIAHGTINYNLGPATLTSITAGVWSRTFNAVDFDFDNKDDSVWVRDEHYRQYSQELRLTSNDTKAAFQYIIGAFYVDSRFTLIETHIWGIPDFPPGSPIQGQIYNGSFVGDFRQNDSTASVFGQATIKPVDKLTINVGARYSHDRKVVHFGRTPDYNNLTLWNTVIQAPFAFQRLDPAVDDLFSGSIAAQYQVARRTMFYLSAARSGKAGGYGEFAGIGADPSIPAVNGLPQGNPNISARVKPERANAYELGVKTSLLDNKLLIDLAGFWTDIFNLQQLTFTGQFVVTNDRLRDQGAEVTFEFRPIEHLTLNGSATYARVRDIVKNEDSVNAPRLSATGSAEWSQPLDASNTGILRIGFRHRSSKYNQLGEQEQDGEFTTMNLGARLENRRGWWANVDVENALDARGANFGFPGPDPFIAHFKTLEPLRRVMLSAGTRF